jgi:hypothetical protein
MEGKKINYSEKRKITIVGHVVSGYTGELVPISKEGFFRLGAGIELGKPVKTSSYDPSYKMYTKISKKPN